MNKVNERKQQIISAAIDVLKTKNFQGMKTLDVAKKAEIAEGSLYRYFKNKDAMFLAIVETISDSFLEKTFKNIEETNDFYKNLEILSENFYRIITEGQDLYKIFWKAFSEVEKEEVKMVIKSYMLNFIHKIENILKWEHPNYEPFQYRMFSNCILGILRIEADKNVLDITQLELDTLKNSILKVGELLYKKQEEMENEKII